MDWMRGIPIIMLALVWIAVLSYDIEKLWEKRKQ